MKNNHFIVAISFLFILIYSSCSNNSSNLKIEEYKEIKINMGGGMSPEEYTIILKKDSGVFIQESFGKKDYEHRFAISSDDKILINNWLQQYQFFEIQSKESNSIINDLETKRISFEGKTLRHEVSVGAAEEVQKEHSQNFQLLFLQFWNWSKSKSSIDKKNVGPLDQH